MAKLIPILFNPLMVQAIMVDSKKVTRRVFDPVTLQRSAAKKNMHPEALCPYGAPGDILYVRETHWMTGWWENTGTTKTDKLKWKFCSHAFDKPVFSEPDVVAKPSDRSTFFQGEKWYKRPAIFLFKKHARTFLRVVDVKVEPLQFISINSAIDEGVISLSQNMEWLKVHFPGYAADMEIYHAHKARGRNERPPIGPCPVSKFKALWISINGVESWAANPWVWVVRFERITDETELNNIKNNL